MAVSVQTVLMPAALAAMMKETAMAKWLETRSLGQVCRIDLEQVTAVVVAKPDGCVDVCLRGDQVLTTEGKVEDFAPMTRAEMARK